MRLAFGLESGAVIVHLATASSVSLLHFLTSQKYLGSSHQSFHDPSL